MDHDRLSISMFWVGALFAIMPVLCASLVLWIWWRQRRMPTDGDARARRRGVTRSDGAG
jgi:hypothetical protein